jgi:long-chain acyl-CoA synthetase
VEEPERAKLPRSIGDVLQRGLTRTPTKEAVVATDRRLTYEQLDAAADHVAARLHEWGLRRGDRLAVSLPNAAAIVVLFHGAMRLGLVWVGVNQNLAPPEKRYLLEHSRSRALVASPSTGIEQLGDQLELGIRSSAALLDEPPGSSGSYPRVGDGLDLPAGLSYTSGTTGRPKGALHTQRNLLLPGAVLVDDRGYDGSLRRGDCAALTILNLQVTSTLMAAQAGGTQIVMDRVDPEGIAGWIRQEHVSSWFGVPTMIHGLAHSAQVAPRDLASLDDVWTGGADLAEPIRTAFEAKFGREIHATYGLTEVPTVVTIEPRHEPHIPGSSGRVLPHLSVRVQVGGHDVSAGKEGEITVTVRTDGPWGGIYTPMLGYVDDPSASQAAVDAGRLRTGDMGLIDAAGNLFVRGRRSALILRGGSNVYPAEVERAILEHPAVAGAAVVGIPDERLGQRVAAAIEVMGGAEVGEDELTDHCVARLARYKVPQSWAFAPLPRNAMGKVSHPEVVRWFSNVIAAEASDP